MKIVGNDIHKYTIFALESIYLTNNINETNKQTKQKRKRNKKEKKTEGKKKGCGAGFEPGTLSKIIRAQG